MAREAVAQHLLPVGEAEALSRHAPGRIIGQREYPIVAACLLGVILNRDAELSKGGPELALGSGGVLRKGDPRPDVANPRVAARAYDLPLCASEVDCLAASRPRLPLLATPLRHDVGKTRQAHLPRHVLKLLVKRLRFAYVAAVAGLEIRVVDDDVCMRDSPLIVIVVDDSHLEVLEVSLHPNTGKTAQRFQVDSVSRVGRDYEMLERPGIQAAPWGVRPVGFARPVHLDVPIDEDRMLARRFADPFLHGEVHHVPRKRPVSLLKVSAYASRSSMPRYGLQDRHHRASTILLSWSFAIS